MPLLDLIRHGAVETPGLLLGRRTDAGLSAEGWEQFARQTAYRHWSAIVSSPLRRARGPVEQLAARLEIPLKIDADWSELDFGIWDGRKLSELRADAMVAEKLDALYWDEDGVGAPGGESWQQLRERVARALATLCQRRDDNRILVATHGGPIRAAISIACDIPFARTWAFRIDYGTRISLRTARGEDGRPWGEIIEVVQP